MLKGSPASRETRGVPASTAPKEREETRDSEASRDSKVNRSGLSTIPHPGVIKVTPLCPPLTVPPCPPAPLRRFPRAKRGSWNSRLSGSERRRRQGQQRRSGASWKQRSARRGAGSHARGPRAGRSPRNPRRQGPARDAGRSRNTWWV